MIDDVVRARRPPPGRIRDGRTTTGWRRALGLDPAEVRQRNSTTPAQMPDKASASSPATDAGSPTNSGDDPAAQARELAAADYDGLPGAKAAARKALGAISASASECGGEYRPRPL